MSTDPSGRRDGDDALFVERNAAVGRRRRAPVHAASSDEWRFSGIAVAAVIGALATLAAVGLLTSPRQLRSPGPLALPHDKAGLTCAKCHDHAPITDACAGCHGPHPSTRRGHAKLREGGKMTCITCHRVHEDFGGVAIAKDGSVLRFGPGATQPLKTRAGPNTAGIVPVVPVGACGGCHDIDAPRDPIARCLLTAAEDHGPRGPAMCFDEHRTPTSLEVARDPKLRGRIAQWAVARRAVAEAPLAPKAAPPDRPGLWLVALGLATSVGLWLSWRTIAAWRRRRRQADSEPVGSADAAKPATVRKLPFIDTSTCIGCHACVDVCPYDVLAVRNYVAEVVRPDDCCGLTLCEQRCPNGSLKIAEGELLTDRPRLDAALQSSDTPGLFLAGDVTGLPLIRNAIHQGQVAVDAIVASLGGRAAPPDVFDLVIVGAGPAGLSAALAAEAAGLRYCVLEQGSVAHSIRSFPRGKLVFDQPLGLPLVGELWLAESTKEELLSKWTRIVREHALPIREQTRVTAVGRDADGAFGIETADGPRLRARRVLLAMGKRGTPRKLACPIPDACEDRVHYHLADARSFAGQRVVVVGLGDVAMETAVALAAQPGTQVTVVARGDDFRRGKQRNIDAVRRAAAAGRISLRWSSEVSAVSSEVVEIDGPDPVAVSWDALFVMIGSIAPWDFLRGAGVHRAHADPPTIAAHRTLPVVQ